MATTLVKRSQGSSRRMITWRWGSNYATQFLKCTVSGKKFRRNWMSQMAGSNLECSMRKLELEPSNFYKRNKRKRESWKKKSRKLRNMKVLSANFTQLHLKPNKHPKNNYSLSGNHKKINPSKLKIPLKNRFQWKKLTLISYPNVLKA